MRLMSQPESHDFPRGARRVSSASRLDDEYNPHTLCMSDLLDG